MRTGNKQFSPLISNLKTYTPTKSCDDSNTTYGFNQIQRQQITPPIIISNNLNSQQYIQQIYHQPNGYTQNNNFQYQFPQIINNKSSTRLQQQINDNNDNEESTSSTPTIPDSKFDDTHIHVPHNNVVSNQIESITEQFPSRKLKSIDAVSPTYFKDNIKININHESGLSTIEASNLQV